MPETKPQDPQAFMRPALKPFVKPSAKPAADEPRPALRPAAPAFGRVTLPPFGPIRYGGPKPGATVIDDTPREDDEAPSWASIEEYVHEAPAPEVAEVEPEPEPETVVAETVEDDTGLFDDVLPPPPVAEEPPVLEEPPLLEEPTPVVVEQQRDEPMPWEAREPEPHPEPVIRRPVLPLTGPSDPTPLMNPTIERSTEPHRMTPMRVTPLRPAAIPAPSPLAASIDPTARAVAAALEMVAARVRRGDLVVSGSMPNNDDPPALAAVLAATAAALLGVRL